MPGGHNRAAGAELFSGFTGSTVIAVTPQLSLRGHTFFCLARKKYAKKRRRTRNSAYAQKNKSFRCAYFRCIFRRPNALRAASSQAPYPSPRRKRQGSSIALLVLSKQQTLRWFAVWSLILSQEKRWWRKECYGTRNSADARKGVSFCCAFFRSSFRSPNALRAASSQTPYPSLPRKRESSSIALLVLSKTQTLRWFVFWFLRASVLCPVNI